MKTAFCFDLDGTLTKNEILPILSKEVGLFDEISALTIATVKGVLPFKKSFLLRCRLLDGIKISRVQEIVEKIELYEEIINFIHCHKEDCFVITGNLDVWVEGLIKKIGCRSFASIAEVENDSLVKVVKVLNKADAIKEIRKEYDQIVAIGDGMGDVPMFENADISIAFGATHPPIETLLEYANFVSFDQKSLVSIMSPLTGEHPATLPIIISAAGLGSRLEMNLPKCLVEVGNKKIIDYQLDLLKEKENIRMVIGFMENEVMDYVSAIRKDIVFVRNPNYKFTSNSHSLHLASKHIDAPFISLDGDIIIEPNSFADFLKRCEEGESIIGYTLAKSEVAVYVVLCDNEELIVDFSLTRPDKEFAYEWTGLAYLNNIKIESQASYVFERIKEFLPLKAQIVECHEIDTPDDLENASRAIVHYFN